MEHFDINFAVSRLERLPRLPADGAGDFESGARAQLLDLGLRVPLEAAASLGAPGSLLLFASRYTGTLSLYELPPALGAPLADALEALSGVGFQRLEDLDGASRGHAVRLLAATRQTGLTAGELADWVSQVGTSDRPSAGELETLENAWGPYYRGEATHGQPPADFPALGRFARVHVIVYDGE